MDPQMPATLAEGGYAVQTEGGDWILSVPHCDPQRVQRHFAARFGPSARSARAPARVVCALF
eukprot:4397200-Prymnesium_polylepis.1